MFYCNILKTWNKSIKDDRAAGGVWDVFVHFNIFNVINCNSSETQMTTTAVLHQTGSRRLFTATFQSHSGGVFNTFKIFLACSNKMNAYKKKNSWKCCVLTCSVKILFKFYQASTKAFGLLIHFVFNQILKGMYKLYHKVALNV